MYNVLKTEKNTSKNDSLNISTLKTNSSKSYKNNMLFTISTTNNDLLKKNIQSNLLKIYFKNRYQ